MGDYRVFGKIAFNVLSDIKGKDYVLDSDFDKFRKATDMMRWIGLMNNIRACADEIVLNDIVYS